jgi:3-hydroxymyristoyl/3-hydroxydecanoyl-(acyl carrier protein) dehydratase
MLVRIPAAAIIPMTTVAMSTHTEKLRIAASHPALPGHFPGNPVVPGVVLLDRVAAAIERAWQVRVGTLAQVKFLRPLLPDQEAELTIVNAGKRILFSIVLEQTPIASGSIEVAP